MNVSPRHVAVAGIGRMGEGIALAFAQAGWRVSLIDLVFEAVPEVLEAKREAFAWIDQRVAPECVIASTTSTFLATGLGSRLGERYGAAQSVLDNMAAGRNGLRDGLGFYDHRHSGVSTYRHERMSALVERLRQVSLLPRFAEAGQDSMAVC